MLQTKGGWSFRSRRFLVSFGFKFNCFLFSRKLSGVTSEEKSARLHLTNWVINAQLEWPSLNTVQDEETYKRDNQTQTVKPCSSHHNPGLNHQHKKTTHLLMGWDQNLGSKVSPAEVKSLAVPKSILQLKRPFK